MAPLATTIDVHLADLEPVKAVIEAAALLCNLARDLRYTGSMELLTPELLALRERRERLAS